MSKTKESVSRRIHIDLDRLLKARKIMLANDGQKFAEKASINDISKEFVEFFWWLFDYYATWDTKGTKLRNEMWKIFKDLKRTETKKQNL